MAKTPQQKRATERMKLARPKWAGLYVAGFGIFAALAGVGLLQNLESMDMSVNHAGRLGVASLLLVLLSPVLVVVGIVVVIQRRNLDRRVAERDELPLTERVRELRDR